MELPVKIVNKFKSLTILTKIRDAGQIAEPASGFEQVNQNQVLLDFLNF